MNPCLKMKMSEEEIVIPASERVPLDEQPSVQTLPRSNPISNVVLSQQKEEYVDLSNIPLEIPSYPLDLRPEDLDSFKDAEISFVDAKYNSELESLGDEGQDDHASKENLGGVPLRLSGKNRPKKTFFWAHKKLLQI